MASLAALELGYKKRPHDWRSALILDFNSGKHKYLFWNKSLHWTLDLNFYVNKCRLITYLTRLMWSLTYDIVSYFLAEYHISSWVVEGI